MGMVEWWAPTDEEPLLQIIKLKEELAKSARASMQAEEVNASMEQMEDTDAAAVAEQMAVEQGMDLDRLEVFIMC